MKIQAERHTDIDRAVCDRCGRPAPTESIELLNWSRQVDRRGSTWLCPACTRENIHSIETGW